LEKTYPGIFGWPNDLPSPKPDKLEIRNKFKIQNIKFLKRNHSAEKFEASKEKKLNSL